MLMILFFMILITSFIAIASDFCILAVLEKVIETSFLFNFFNTLEDITVQTKLCFSHFLTFLAAITVVDISIYFYVTCQVRMLLLTVTNSS